jgi:hypothetical protein
MVSKPINEYSKLSGLDETLLNNTNRSRAIKAQIISNKGELVDCLISLSNKFEIIASQNLSIQIDYLDILGFVRESINDPQSFKRSVDVIKIQERENKTIGMLNFFPKEEITSFSFTGIFKCKCYSTLYERQLKVIID